MPAYAVCQKYNPDNKPTVQVTVCDSGIGVIDQIRAALPIHYAGHPEYQDMSDEELILKIFRFGLSSKGPIDGGDGLVSCAAQAMKFNAQISIRTNNTLTVLKSDEEGYIAVSYTHLTLPTILRV